MYALWEHEGIKANSATGDLKPHANTWIPCVQQQVYHISKFIYYSLDCLDNPSDCVIWRKKFSQGDSDQNFLAIIKSAGTFEQFGSYVHWVWNQNEFKLR